MYAFIIVVKEIFMADFIVDETRFIIDDGEYDFWFFEEGFRLPDGIVISEKIDETDQWQLYASLDSRYTILAAKAELARKWLEGGYLKEEDLWHFPHGNEDYYLLINPAGLKLQRINQTHLGKSRRFALSFLAAFNNTRGLDTDVNLRDAIFCELHCVMLPSFTLLPKIQDRVLFENALRKPQKEGEVISDVSEGSGGLSFFSVRKLLKEYGAELEKVVPYLESGEPIDDFIQVKDKGGIITGPLVLRKHYQIFDTNCDTLLLMLDELWTNALLHTSLISQMSLVSINIDGQKLAVLPFDKRKALEPLDDRHFGMNKDDVIEVAQAVRRTRTALPKAKLDNALYIQEQGILLPESFETEEHDDKLLMRDITINGPFAMAPFLDDHKVDAILIATSL